ncbi:MAG TPA: preprotein translocase subunit SecG [Candidatus Coproplasma stercoravium]|nr:preprotein translocase subunit SecG [Candidatus Coproplasma stercoravium]
MLTALLARTDSGLTGTEYTIYITFTLIFMALLFIAAIVAIIVVMFQKSNSDGIQGITATSETFFGKNKGRSIESKLKKWTWITLIVLGVLSVVIYIVQIMLP